ncbi:MAG: DUF2088 domain-containing protein [Chloroflexota bacterium]
MKIYEQIQSLDFPAQLPSRLLAVKQTFDSTRLEDVAQATRDALKQCEVITHMQKGDSVAIGVGSRGINNLGLIVKTTVDAFREAGLNPFVIPAMGSHAGATAEGQKQMLANLGVSEETVGAEVRATMEADQIGQVPDGPPLFQDVNAIAADHTFLINRIKAHTAFRGTVESGLAKMEVIGIGKQKGAALMHNLGVSAFQNYLVPAARIYEAETNVIGGLALVENGYDETCDIVGFTDAEIGGPKEAALLEKSKALMPSIPFAEIEVLVIKQAGKNISGTGMDPNILGRLMIPRQEENFGGPDICLVALLDLTEQTHGNANGMGLANVTTARVVEKIDWQATYMNALTAGILGMQRCSMPITLPTDHKALQVAVRNCGYPADEARIVFINDTLNLTNLWVSPNMQAEVEANSNLAIVDEVALEFGDNGVMISPWALS